MSYIGQGSYAEKNSCQTLNGNIKSRIWRITNSQYRNIINDLFDFGSDVNFSKDFENDTLGELFQNESDKLRISSTKTRDYSDGANAVTKLLKERGLSKASKNSASCIDNFDNQTCAKKWIESIGNKLYKGHFTNDHLTNLLKIYSISKKEGLNGEDSLLNALNSMLRSPFFLFRFELAPNGNLSLNDYAYYLSFTLWNSIPDSSLLNMITALEIITPETITPIIKHMANDNRFERFITNFAIDWLSLNSMDTSLDQKIRDSMFKEIILYLTSIFRENGNIESLLTSKYSFINSDLEKIYKTGVFDNTENDQLIKFSTLADGYKKINFSEETEKQRVGLLTLPGVISSQRDSVPFIFRGLYVLDKLFCFHPSQPTTEQRQQAADDIEESLSEGLQGLALDKAMSEKQIANISCTACHTPINNVGFGLYNFTNHGEYRTHLGDQKIDSVGELDSFGVKGTFRNTSELVNLIKDSSTITQCMNTNLFRYIYGKVETKKEKCKINSLSETIFNSKKSILESMIHFLSSSYLFKRTQ